LIIELKAVVIGIIPLLRREIIIALPYLELYAIGRFCGKRSLVTTRQNGQAQLTCTSVKTEVGPRDLHLGAASLDDPTLRLGAVAIISITGG